MPHAARVVPSSVPDVLGSDARALDPDLRALLAASGQEPGGVRVHTGAAAAESARAMNAAAYTVGTHIVLDETQARPGTARRRQLLVHELAHVAQQRASGPAVQLATKTDPLREALDPPLELNPGGVLPEPGPGQPGEAKAIGSAGERLDVERLRTALHQAGYDEVYAKDEFARSRDGWLNRAFPDKWSGPDLVAIRNTAGAKQVLVLDVTSGTGSVADIKPGDKRSLPVEWETRTSPGFRGNQYGPRDLTHELKLSQTHEVPVQPYESVKQPHIAKTIDDAHQVARNLPEHLKGYSVVAREYHWRTGELTKPNIVKGRLQRVAPTPSGGMRGPAEEPGIPPKASAAKSEPAAPTVTAPKAPVTGRSTPSSVAPLKQQILIRQEIGEQVRFVAQGEVKKPPSGSPSVTTEPSAAAAGIVPRTAPQPVEGPATGPKFVSYPMQEPPVGPAVGLAVQQVYAAEQQIYLGHEWDRIDADILANAAEAKRWRSRGEWVALYAFVEVPEAPNVLGFVHQEPWELPHYCFARLIHGRDAESVARPPEILESPAQGKRFLPPFQVLSPQEQVPYVPYGHKVVHFPGRFNSDDGDRHMDLDIVAGKPQATIFSVRGKLLMVVTAKVRQPQLPGLLSPPPSRGGGDDLYIELTYQELGGELFRSRLHFAPDGLNEELLSFSSGRTSQSFWQQVW